MNIREMPYTETPAWRARSLGLGALSTPELLQLVTRVKSLDQATEIYHRAGASIKRLFQMGIEEITEVAGVGEATALSIKAAFELAHRNDAHMPQPPQIRCPKDAADIVMAMIGHEPREVLIVLLLDAQNRVIGEERVYKGTVNASPVRPAEVLQQAILRSAPAIIVAHNHPSGDCTPSPEDIAITHKLNHACEAMDIDLLDHLIVSGSKYVSMKERRLGGF